MRRTWILRISSSIRHNKETQSFKSLRADTDCNHGFTDTLKQLLTKTAVYSLLDFVKKPTKREYDARSVRTLSASQSTPWNRLISSTKMQLKLNFIKASYTKRETFHVNYSETYPSSWRVSITQPSIDPWTCTA